VLSSRLVVRECFRWLQRELHRQLRLRLFISRNRSQFWHEGTLIEMTRTHKAMILVGYLVLVRTESSTKRISPLFCERQKVFRVVPSSPSRISLCESRCSSRGKESRPFEGAAENLPLWKSLNHRNFLSPSSLTFHLCFRPLSARYIDSRIEMATKSVDVRE